MKLFLLYWLLLGILHSAAHAQTSALPAKQTIEINFIESDKSIDFSTKNIAPFVPLEFKGNWPDNTNAKRLTIRLLSTNSKPQYSDFPRLKNSILLFNFGAHATLTKPANDNLIPIAATNSESSGASTIRLNENSQRKKDFDVASAVVELSNHYATGTTVNEAGKKDFSILLLAPELRRYYGVEIIEEEQISSAEFRNQYTTAGSSGELPMPVLYSGNLALVPSEWLIPYSSGGAGFLGINGKTTGFFTTSAGFIFMFRPVYSGLHNPYIHRHSIGFWSGGGQWLLNRTFVSLGVTTTSLNYRGESLSSSAVKGAGGVGLFLFPGIGVSFDYTVGGTVNYNPSFDNRTQPFYMPAVSLRLTGQFTDLFKNKLGEIQPSN